MNLKNQISIFCLLVSEKLREKWERVNPRGKKWIKILAVLAVLALLFGIFRLSLAARYPYHSTKSLAKLYQSHQTDFQAAVETLTALPQHADPENDPFYPDTAIMKDSDWDPERFQESGQTVGELRVLSGTPYTDAELQAISDAVLPLFEQADMVIVHVSASREVICFAVFDSAFSEEQLIHRDCINYDASSILPDQGEFLEQYRATAHYGLRRGRTDYPDDYEIIADHWYVTPSSYW